MLIRLFFFSILMVLGPFSMAASASPVIKIDRAPAGGADGGGGGNILKNQLTTSQDFDEAIAFINRDLRRVLYFQNYISEALNLETISGRAQNNLDGSTLLNLNIPLFLALADHNAKILENVDLSILRKVYSKLFDNHGPAYSALARTRFERKEESCVDRYQQKKDGSVADPKTGGSICLSFAGFRNKLPLTSLPKKILALAVHELSHRVGATEVEAVALQTVVEATMNVSSFNEIEGAFFKDKRSLSSLATLTSDLRYSLSVSPADPIQTCMVIARLSDATALLVKNQGTMGVLSGSVRSLKGLYTGLMEIEYMKGYCQNNGGITWRQFGDGHPPSEAENFFAYRMNVIQNEHPQFLVYQGLFLEPYKSVEGACPYLDHQALARHFENWVKNFEIFSASDNVEPIDR